jgi:hypothetical protein
MVHSAISGDRVALAVATDDLGLALEKLWDLRSERDENWQAILNHAQGAVKELFHEKRVESLSPDECQAAKHLVERCLGPATKTEDDLLEATRLIEDMGCDPFWAISGNPGDVGEV